MKGLHSDEAVGGQDRGTSNVVICGRLSRVRAVRAHFVRAV